MMIQHAIARLLVFSFVLAALLLPRSAATQENREPSRGRFLVAGRQMQDPRFRETVVLLLSVERSGAAGLIINRPSDAKLSNVFSTMRRAAPKQDRIYYGGPVEPSTALMLLKTTRTTKQMQPVLTGVAVSTSREVIKSALRKKRAGSDYRLFLGYAGWTFGQLQHEIARGDWYVVEADADTVFHEDEAKVWPRLIRKGEEIIVQERERRPLLDLLAHKQH